MADLTFWLVMALWGAVIVLWFVHWRRDLKFHRALIKVDFDLESRIIALEEHVGVLPLEATNFEKLRAAMKKLQRSLTRQWSEKAENDVLALLAELKEHLPPKVED